MLVRAVITWDFELIELLDADEDELDWEDDVDWVEQDGDLLEKLSKHRNGT